MSCNKCNNENIHQCGCDYVEFCGCETETDLLCTNYSGEHLNPLNISPGTDGAEIVKIINDKIQEMLEDIENKINDIESVGEGHHVYKGITPLLKHQIRSLLEGEGIIITSETDDTLNISVDEDWLAQFTSFKNVGIGQNVYKGWNNGQHEIRRLSSEDNSVSIIPSLDANTLDFKVNFPTPPTVDYPVIDGEAVGGGTPIYSGLDNKRIQISSIHSDTLLISKDEDESSPTYGMITIEAVGNQTSNDWYLDANYNRPFNWVPDETINGVPLPKGTLNDPFKTYQEYRLKFIGQGVDGVGQPYDFVNPKYGGKRLQITSNIETDEDMEINNQIINLNKVYLKYTGTNEYMFDYAKIYDLLPRTGGQLAKSMSVVIGGEGLITRTDRQGIIKHKTSEAETQNYITAVLNLLPSGGGLEIVEGVDNEPYVELTNATGDVLRNGGAIVKGMNAAPTTPLILIDGNNKYYWSAAAHGTKLFVRTCTQVAWRIKNGGRMTSSVDRLMHSVSNTNVGYIKRLQTGDTMTPEEQEIFNYRISYQTQGGVLYLPHPTFNVYHLTEGSVFRIEKLDTEPNSFTHTAANSIFYLDGGSHVYNLISMNDVGGGSAINFIEAVGPTTTFTISNGNLLDLYNNLVRGTGSNNVTLQLKNAYIPTVNKISKDIGTLTIDTLGTMSSIKNLPIISLNSYADSASAIAAGMIQGMLYRNTTTGQVTQI